MHARKWMLVSLPIVLFLTCVSSNLLVAIEEAALPSYELNVKIEPELGSIAVQGVVETKLENPSTHDLRFNLHETFTISKLRINGEDASFTYAPMTSIFMPAARTVVVSLPHGLTSDNVHMEIDYAGRLKNLTEFNAAPNDGRAMDDQVNSRMVELALYSSWYPQFIVGQPLRAHFEMSLPAGWISICSGTKLGEAVREGRVTTRWSSPNDFDVVIAASPDYRIKTVQQAGVGVQIYYTRMPESFLNGETAQVASAVKLYSDNLGETTIPGGVVRHVYSPKRKGQGKAGMARAGLIVTSEGLTLESLDKNPNFSLFQPIAHEIAHFWWHFGAGQGDWINEAFAECFSAVAVEKIASQEEFKNVLADYRKQVRQLPADAPPLSSIPASNDNVGFVVRYYKGALMLDDLRSRLGDAKFFAACRDFFQTYKGKTIGTPEFRSFWEKVLPEHQEILTSWLDSRGGLPDSTKAGSK